jgi:hypothetical protein
MSKIKFAVDISLMLRNQAFFTELVDCRPFGLGPKPRRN